MEAKVFDIYRGTSHDGPGLRTTVFFQGCTLNCAWCHNPEGISPKGRIWWDSRACIGCGICHEVCGTGANQLTESGVTVDTEKCVRCGVCAENCPTQAVRFTCDSWSLDKLVKEAQKDLPFYQKSGGGVTASGGECLMQWQFLTEFFRSLKEQGIDTALDTCGNVAWEHMASVLPYTDHVLYDLKIMDSDAHRRWTGDDNARILHNLRRIEDKDIWIRTPLIPGATDSVENIRAIARFLTTEMAGRISRWELPAFNNSCTNKYLRLERAWEFADAPMIRETQANALLETAREIVGDCFPVTVTGLLAGSLTK